MHVANRERLVDAVLKQARGKIAGGDRIERLGLFGVRDAQHIRPNRVVRLMRATAQSDEPPPAKIVIAMRTIIRCCIIEA